MGSARVEATGALGHSVLLSEAIILQLGGVPVLGVLILSVMLSGKSGAKGLF